MSDLWEALINSAEPQQNENLDHLQTDFERAQYLKTILNNQATNDGESNDDHYKKLRRYFLEKPDTRNLVPDWVRTRRDLKEFWQFIKHQFAHYQERREFIWSEMQPLLSYLEVCPGNPQEKAVSEQLFSLSSDYVVNMWQKALERKATDADGAITAARSLLEAVIKHILDEMKVEYSKTADLHELYKSISEKLKLNTDQHEDKSIKRILGGCSSVISGISELRNLGGDAHGHGKRPYRPSARHAELAVNMAGTMCLFIIQTYIWRKKQSE